MTQDPSSFLLTSALSDTAVQHVRIKTITDCALIRRSVCNSLHQVGVNSYLKSIENNTRVMVTTYQVDRDISDFTSYIFCVYSFFLLEMDELLF